ncbi:MAG: T9SS type A sorting domain-containing protein [Marinilabiliaceae bacterium]|nr:T9SS type A sorting domain-containing protein [Marinilabiliaceae bacterium]
MKNLIFAGIFFLTCAINAQYTTPGTGVVWNFNDLVDNSGGVVVTDPDNPTNGFIVNATVTVEEPDEILIITDIVVRIKQDFDIVFNSSKFTVDAPGQALFTAFNQSNEWGRIVIDDDAIVDLKNAKFTYGKGIRVAIDPTGSFIVDNCEFSYNFDNDSSPMYAAINLTEGFATIKNSTFLDNYYAAIASGANTSSTFIIENNYFEGNVTSNTNRPQINIGPCAAGDTSKIIGNTIIGNRLHTMAGGIGTSSLLSVSCAFLIQDNFIQDNRYGITLTGSNIYGKIIGNVLLDNNTEVNPMMGGSGINITNSASNVFAYISQNFILGHLWGITAVGNVPYLTHGPYLNLGNIDVEPDHPDYNIGMNFFRNNGNGGLLYDFYNNNPHDIMAQNNNWGVETQDFDNISTVVWHQPTDERFGLVTFMPPYIETYTVSGRVVAENEPLVGAQLNVEIGENVYSTTINSDGVFEFTAENNAFISITITCEGYYDYTNSFTIEDADVDLGDIVMIPIDPPTYTVSGRVVDENGPLSALLFVEIDGVVYTVTLESDGVFEFTAENNAFISITITCGGYHPQTISFTIEDDDVDLGDIVMIPFIPPTYTVSGRVVDENGPLQGANVHIIITQDYGTYDILFLTDETGIFEVADIIKNNATVTIKIDKIGYDSYENSFIVEDEDVTLGDILLTKIQFPAPQNFEMTYTYYKWDEWGMCAGDVVYGPTYCSTFQWEVPYLTETSAQLTGYNLYYYYTDVYYEGMEIPIDNVVLVAHTTNNYLQMEVGIIGLLWVTAVYTEPEGESVHSNYEFNDDLPISIDKSEIPSYSIVYNQQERAVEIFGIENIKSIAIYGLDGILLNSIDDCNNIIEMKNISQGVYIIKITTETGNIISDKIVVF